MLKTIESISELRFVFITLLATCSIVYGWDASEYTDFHLIIDTVVIAQAVEGFFWLKKNATFKSNP